MYWHDGAVLHNVLTASTNPFWHQRDAECVSPGEGQASSVATAVVALEHNHLSQHIRDVGMLYIESLA